MSNTRMKKELRVVRLLVLFSLRREEELTMYRQIPKHDVTSRLLCSHFRVFCLCFQCALVFVCLRIGPNCTGTFVVFNIGLFIRCEPREAVMIKRHFDSYIHFPSHYNMPIIQASRARIHIYL